MVRWRHFPQITNELYPTRVVPFKFSKDQQYVLEVGRNHQDHLPGWSGDVPSSSFPAYPGTATQLLPGQFYYCASAPDPGVYMVTTTYVSGDITKELAEGKLVAANFAWNGPGGWPQYGTALVVEVLTPATKVLMFST